MFTRKGACRYTTFPKTVGFDGYSGGGWAADEVRGSGLAKRWAKGVNDKE